MIRRMEVDVLPWKPTNGPALIIKLKWNKSNQGAIAQIKKEPCSAFAVLNEKRKKDFMKKEQKWENVTESFSERQRHYKNTYLEICEVFDEVVEVSVFSSATDPYEIYFSYGRFYGIIYAEKNEAYKEFEEVKRELEAEYRKRKEPTGEFINEFARRHKVSMPNDILFDTDAFFDAFM